MIKDQQRIIISPGETTINTPPLVSTKPPIVSMSSIDSDVSDRRDVRETLWSGIFKKHRKTILVIGSFLKILNVNRRNNKYASIKAAEEPEAEQTKPELEVEPGIPEEDEKELEQLETQQVEG